MAAIRVFVKVRRGGSLTVSCPAGERSSQSRAVSKPGEASPIVVGCMLTLKPITMNGL